MKFLALALCGFALDGGREVGAGLQDHGHVRGVTISCQTSGFEWGLEGFGRELDELCGLGANWVAIHPYARIRSDGEVRHRLDPDRPPGWLTHPLKEARARGMSILIKPHLGYWGSKFRWRGEIHFEDAVARARFWTGYTDWITTLAEIVGEADAFCVGTELDRMVEDPAPWRSLIAAVRARTDARLTYAANWDGYGRVTFWDALDAVGVQAYFPLSEEPDPDVALLEAGWERVLVPLRELHRRTGKPVVFTELGYNRSIDAAKTPWSDTPAASEDRAAAEALQARCLRVGLEVIERESDWLRGAFLWKWFVGEPSRHDRSFYVDTPRMRAAIAEVW